MVPKYKRILLKLSGESLMGNKNFGFDNDVIAQYAADIKLLTEIGVDVEDAASHERRNVGGRMTVRYDGSGKIPMQLELAARGRVDHDGAAPYLFGGQRHDAGLVRLSGGLRCR